jgi:hypothetical protein
MGQALVYRITLGKTVVSGRLKESFRRVPDGDVLWLRARSATLNSKHTHDQTKVQIVCEVDQSLPK